MDLKKDETVYAVNKNNEVITATIVELKLPQYVILSNGDRAMSKDLAGTQFISERDKTIWRVKHLHESYLEAKKIRDELKPTVPTISPKDCAFFILKDLRDCGRNIYKYTYGALLDLAINEVLRVKKILPASPCKIDEGWKKETQTELVSALRELGL